MRKLLKLVRKWVGILRGGCKKCGRITRIGDWPFCHGDPAEHGNDGRYGHTPFEEYIDPHILPHSDSRAHETGVHPVLGRITGTRITSREQRRKIMKEQGLDWAGREHGTGGMEV